MSRESQKEGQEEQGEVKELGGSHLAAVRSPGPPGLPFCASLGSLELPQSSLESVLGLKIIPNLPLELVEKVIGHGNKMELICYIASWSSSGALLGLSRAPFEAAGPRQQ